MMLFPAPPDSREEKILFLPLELTFPSQELCSKLKFFRTEKFDWLHF